MIAWQGGGGVVFLYWRPSRSVRDPNTSLAGVVVTRLGNETSWTLENPSQCDYVQTCVWTMNVSISIVESDSQWVLTHILSQWLVLWLRRFLYCLIHDCCAFMPFLLTIFLLFPFVNSHIFTITVKESVFTHLLSRGTWSTPKTMLWWLISWPYHVTL